MKPELLIAYETKLRVAQVARTIIKTLEEAGELWDTTCFADIESRDGDFYVHNETMSIPSREALETLIDRDSPGFEINFYSNTFPNENLCVDVFQDRGSTGVLIHLIANTRDGALNNFLWDHKPDREAGLRLLSKVADALSSSFFVLFRTLKPWRAVTDMEEFQDADIFVMASRQQRTESQLERFGYHWSPNF